jgi:outer membrane protein TolC
MKADRTANEIVKEKQKEAFGRSEPFSIEKPSDTLRKMLFVLQGLPHSAPISLGSSYLQPIEHWPEEEYPAELNAAESNGLQPALGEDGSYTLTLMDALGIGAKGSREYQDQKEDVFRAALNLDLERDDFRNVFSASLAGTISADLSAEENVAGVETTGTGSVSRTLENGLSLTTQLGLDLVKLLTLDRSSSLGLFADTTITIPLLRGAGRHIVAEPLIQAERDVVYALYRFERFKRTFAVQIASSYLEVLRLLDQVGNEEENYRSLIASRRRARRLADAGRLSEIQVDQAKQDELRARNRWISAMESYERRLDSFKLLLGLPVDARISLDRDELVTLAESGEGLLSGLLESDEALAQRVPPADSPAAFELLPPDIENKGPLEIDEAEAVKLAFENRLDLRIALGEVYDNQRSVVVAADALRPELTLLGTASMGERRRLSSAELANAGLRPGGGFYSALLSFDLGLERTAERIEYRQSLIDLEKSVRGMQALEDSIKLEIRNKLRDLIEARESLRIQALSKELAQKRVKSANLFLEAGMAQIRDLLEAQEALISAQNALTSALVRYRVAELELQRDLGVLEVNEKGVWREYEP